MDNEQRAHDIALTYAKITVEFEMNQAIKNGETTIAFDLYPIYKEAYDKALETINRDFE